MAALKKYRVIFTVIFFALALAAAFTAGIFVHLGVIGSPKPEITSDVISNEIRSVSELATLEYRYTNVGKYEDRIEFYGWAVPLTAKSFIITYDGSMKLGINAADISVEVDGTKILVKLPDVQILSHEIFEDTLKVLDQSQNVFNHLKVEDYTSFATDQKLEMEQKARESEVFTDAHANAKLQIKGIIQSLPGIVAEYEILFL